MGGGQEHGLWDQQSLCSCSTTCRVCDLGQGTNPSVPPFLICKVWRLNSEGLF